MNKHDNIYNILNKLSALEPPVKQESILKNLSESLTPAQKHLSQLLAEKHQGWKDTVAAVKESDEKTMSRAKHDKYDESVEVDEDMLAKRDYDGDGKKESGEDEYMGSRDRAIKKAMSTKKIKEGEDDVVPGKSWVKDPSDPASKVPAYQRKANEPGRQAAQDRADASNAKVGAKVFRSGRTAPMEEEQYDENDAHSSLPGVRKTTEQEHSRYDAAAHEIRKWMRKRGWNTNKEFKSALKYIMDNLDDKHDDSLTHKVKEAAKICEKHHATMVEAGLDMNLLSKAQGAMQGANTDPESERNRGKKYGYRSDRDDTGNDDDYDEHGNEKKGAKKSAPSDGPKKKGRPKKNFGPERVTAKAYKHKGERKTNEGRAIDLEHYVEDTMAELEAMFIVEKAKSKSQQRFFGMVHATQKGDKPASKEVEKAAKGMSKKDAMDFAKTKHKGLPNKVSEGINFAEMMRETDQTVEEMLNELHGEMDEYKRTGYLGDKLRDALDIHRHNKKLMDNEIPDLQQVPPDSTDAVSISPASATPMAATPIKPTVPNPKAGLSELARLAGIEPIEEEPNEGNEFSGARANAIRAGKDTFTVGGKTFQVTDAEDEQMNEGGCNMTAEGQYCEMHGMNECGMMEDAKPVSQESSYNDPNTNPQSKDYGPGNKDDLPFNPDDEPPSDKDEFGNTIKNRARHLARKGLRQAMADKDKKIDEDLDECGDMGPMSGMNQQDGISINTSMDTKSGRKTVTVTADGEAAEELAQMLKMAGMVGRKPEPKVLSLDQELDEYANEPDERYAGIDAITRAGNDLNRPKKQDPGTANRAANPLGETAVQEDKLFKLYQSLKDIV